MIEGIDPHQTGARNTRYRVWWKPY